VRFYTATPTYQVRASLMLRHVSDRNNGPDEIMQMMGFSNKSANDEVKVITSRDLVGRVVDDLDLCTTYASKQGSRWLELYPCDDLKATMTYSVPQQVVAYVQVTEDGYLVKVKLYRQLTQRLKLKDLSQPIQTNAGELKLEMPKNVKKGQYRVTINPRLVTIDLVIAQINVTRMARESDIITLTTTTDSPKRMEATINMLLSYYNQEATADKNHLAVQTEQFLANRIAVVEQELNDLESEIESYKRTQQIADLSKTADNYLELGDSYEQQVAWIDAQLQMVEFVLAQMDDPERAYSMIPGNITSQNDMLNASLISDYNNHITHRNELLQTATEQNLMVLKENEMIAQKRLSIKESMMQDRENLLMKRQTLVSQQNQYATRLASIPETERRYLELSRQSEAKEKQYLFLIEKREENALLLSSVAVPGRIVETAQCNPSPSSPVLRNMVLKAGFIGMILPLLVFFFGIFRKEYL